MSSHLIEMPQFGFEGRTYRFKRIGAKTTKDLIHFLKTAWKNGVLDLSVHLQELAMLAPQGRDDEGNPIEMSHLKADPETLMFFCVDHGVEHFFGLMELYLLEVTPEGPVAVTYADMEDEDRFPLHSLVTLFAYFVSHPDFSMFLKAFTEGKDLPFFQKLKEKMGTVLPKQ